MYRYTLHTLALHTAIILYPLPLYYEVVDRVAKSDLDRLERIP